MLKSFAFWPQISLGLPALSTEMQGTVVESALDMFLACYQVQ
jgi:TetR/AcrR family transcriptional regulator of autoinduction and epiphytic fitness